MSFAKHLMTWFIIATHLSGCSTKPPVVSEAQRSSMGIVGVAPFSGAAKVELNVGVKGRVGGGVQGAAAGGALGGLEFLGSLGGSSCSGYACGAVILLLPIFVLVGAAAGTVAGASQAVPDDKAQRIEALLNSVLTDIGKQKTLRSKVVEAAAQSGVLNVKEITVETTPELGESVDYRIAPIPGIDTVLEVGLARVGLIGSGGEDPQLCLRVHAVARLLAVRTNEELYRNDVFTHFTRSRKFSEWAADGALLLKRDLGRAYESLATSIVDEVFLVIRSN